MKKIYLSVIASTILLFTGCNDILNFYPETELSESQVWQSLKDFQAATGRLYGYLSTPGIDNHADLFLMYNEMTVLDEQRGNIKVPESDGTWNGNYSNLRSVNMILKKAAEYENPEELKACVSEAHFFRAYFYQKLYEAYGGVPIITSVLDVDSEELYKPRATREATFNFILDELKLAIENLPLQREIASTDYGRVSQEGAKALRARVCLREGTWRKYRGQTGYETLFDQAVKDAYDVIQSGAYEIFYYPSELGDESYKYLFILEDEECCPSKNLKKKDNKEFILARRYNGVFAKTGSITRWVAPTRKMIDMFVCKNGLPIEYSGQTNPQFGGYTASKTSEFDNRDLRLTTLVRQEGKVYYWFSTYAKWGNPNPPTDPYTNNFGSGSGTGYMCDKFSSERYVDSGDTGFDTPVIRYAEVLLIYAEALYEKNGSISDTDLNLSINELRKRGGVDPLTNQLVSDNGLNMLEEIRRERTVELYREGFRLDDLKRWNTVKEVMSNEDICGFYLGSGTPWSKFSRGKDKDENGFYLICSKSKRVWNDYFEVSPLPYDQLRLSKGTLKQNPGYDDGGYN